MQLLEALPFSANVHVVQTQKRAWPGGAPKAGVGAAASVGEGGFTVRASWHTAQWLAKEWFSANVHTAQTHRVEDVGGRGGADDAGRALLQRLHDEPCLL